MITYLDQRSNDLAGFLVYSFWAPVIVNVFQHLCNPIVFPEQQRVQRGQEQTLVAPTVSSLETLHSLPPWILLADWVTGYRGKIGSPFGIPESAVDDKFPIEAGEITEGVLQLWCVAVHDGSVHERWDGVHLLSLQSLTNISFRMEEAGCYGAEKRHAAVCVGGKITCLETHSIITVNMQMFILMERISLTFCLFPWQAFLFYDCSVFTHVWMKFWRRPDTTDES